MGPAIEYAPNRYRFHHTMLEMRKLVKRTATMLYAEGKLIEDRPFVVLHATNCVPLPLMAFASHQLDWEAYYGQSDYQDRFSNGYILAESTGLQSGCVPQVLLDSDQTPDRNQATALALLLPYCLLDIQQNHLGPTEATAKTLNAIRNYGYGEPGVEVFPCYDAQNPLRVSGNVRAALVRREQSALVLVGDFGSDGKFSLDVSESCRAFTSYLNVPSDWRNTGSSYALSAPSEYDASRAADSLWAASVLSENESISAFTATVIFLGASVLSRDHVSLKSLVMLALFVLP